MSLETDIPDQTAPSKIELLKQWIDEDSTANDVDVIEQLHGPQTRREAKKSLTRQERDDRKRAGNLVIKVLDYKPTLDQIVPVDSTMTRGRTSPIAITIAQDRLRAHGLETEVVLEEPAANNNYVEVFEGDMLEPYKALKISGIDEDRVNLSSPKHAR